LRILKLLEEHHKQLAKALASTGSVKPADANLPTGKLQPENEKKDVEQNKVAEKPKEAEKTAPKEKSIPAEKTAPSDSKPKDASSSKPNLAHLSVRRPPRREMRSSIVADLAAARGKPSAAQQRRALPTTPEVTAQHASGMVTSTRSPPQGPAGGNGPATPPPTVAPRSTTTTAANSNNDAFQQFFNSFETVFHKLSAPLAFAGLPLIPEQAPTEPADGGKSTKKAARSTRATAEPDLTKIFSEPTLRALREDVGPAFGSHESFYVVPPSGGTRSYAAIVRSGTNDDEDEDGEDDEDDEIGSDAEFVDARESMGSSATPPTSMRVSLSLGRAVAAATGGTAKGKPGKGKGKGASPKKTTVRRPPQDEPRSAGGKTMEELELENGALRQLLDTQSRRLAMWEASAQSQSMALAQSLRLARSSARSPPAGPALPGAADAGGGAALLPPATESERVREMEEALNAERARREAAEHRLDKSQRENEKLLAVLGKYRDKWELLKESARKREKKKGDVRKGGPADD
jgi:hypothetical protein